MALKKLEHYLLRAQDLEKSKRFYTEILGLQVGYRPPFLFQGYWLYLHDTPVIHLVAALTPNKAQQHYLDHGDHVSADGTGAIDHIAFHADNFTTMLQHLNNLSVKTLHRTVPEEGGVQQIFIWDPDGIKIELNFAERV